ncbi:hypothetical protein O3M35_005777 [Rhynocoris fuscipes]|uniref:Uncharacterized protein n=1 Tax=Rhynocoris fuscipes TaxID=488301 RepID=A0AAW1DRE2_9HEMI
MFQNTYGTEWTSTEASTEERSGITAADSTEVPPFVYETDNEDSSLQDIDVGETRSSLSQTYVHFEPRKYKKSGQGKQSELVKVKINKKPAGGGNVPPVQVTSYVADSDTAVPMKDFEENNKTSKGGGADMISAFFVAPEDEVNEIEKASYSGRPIVVQDLKDDLVRNERYSTSDVSKTLTNDILAPIRAAVTLSQDNESPTIEKQELRTMPVYKTYIEIQKAIPYELKDMEQKEERPIDNDVIQQQHLQFQQQQQQQRQQYLQQFFSRPPVAATAVRNPLMYRYPTNYVYYVPHGYIGNYMVRNSYENAGYRNTRPLQYFLKYQPQLYTGFVLGQPAYYLATPATDESADLNVLQSEARPFHAPPFRPSHPVYTSQYPPYTYRVMMPANTRGAQSRSSRSKQLCIEYGGFKPPMVPSVQIEEALAAEQAQQALALEDSQEQ